MQKEADFYEKLPAFADFLRLDDSSLYQQAPADWVVVISDIQGSTKAIQEGKYKLVNMLGASSIAAVVNALLSKGHSRQIAFVFGGDGATALIPGAYAKVVEASLLETQKRAQQEFGFSLRVGMIPHQDLINAGAPVLVAKFAIAKDNYIAFFKGKGLTQAEKWLKSGQYVCSPQVSSRPLDFDPQKGMSCRWAPLKSGRDLFLTILIKMNEMNHQPEILTEIIRKIDKIIDFNHPDTHPVKTVKMIGEKMLRAVRFEKSLISNVPILTSLKIFITLCLAYAFDKGWLKSKHFSMSAYKNSVRLNSDFRKYDEVLRMVLDVDQMMVVQVTSLLEDYHSRGLLFYGLHESDTALMTCFVQDSNSNDHVHFIDGGDGGYALAAVQMKKQMAADLSKA